MLAAGAASPVGPFVTHPAHYLGRLRGCAVVILDVAHDDQVDVVEHRSDFEVSTECGDVLGQRREMQVVFAFNTRDVRLGDVHAPVSYTHLTLPTT